MTWVFANNHPFTPPHAEEIASERVHFDALTGQLWRLPQLNVLCYQKNWDQPFPLDSLLTLGLPLLALPYQGWTQVPQPCRWQDGPLLHLTANSEIAQWLAPGPSYEISFDPYGCSKGHPIDPHRADIKQYRQMPSLIACATASLEGTLEEVSDEEALPLVYQLETLNLKTACLLVLLRMADNDLPLAVICGLGKLPPPWRRLLQHLNISVSHSDRVQKFSSLAKELDHASLANLATEINSVSVIIPPQIIAKSFAASTGRCYPNCFS